MRKSPRKSSPRKLKKATPLNEKKRLLFIVPDDAVEKQQTTPALVKLRHPKTDSEGQFLFSGDNRHVCEVMKFSEEPRSWFVGETVHKDGSIYVCTNVDPLFLIIPYLEKQKDKFMLLDQVVTDADFPECHRLLSCDGVTEHVLRTICDHKKVDDDLAYRLNPSRTLEWLTAKVDRLSALLEERGVHVAGGSKVATFVRSKKDDPPITKDAYRKFSFHLIDDYLSDGLAAKLRGHLGIEEEVVAASPPDPPDEKEQPSAKRSKLNPVEPSEDYSDKASSKSSKQNKVQKLTNAQRALSKVDKSGMKSISSFFGHK